MMSWYQSLKRWRKAVNIGMMVVVMEEEERRDGGYSS